MILKFGSDFTPTSPVCHDKPQLLMQRARRILEKMGALETDLGATIVESMGIVELRNGQTAKALKFYEESRQLLSSIGKLSSHSGALLLSSIGQAKKRLKDNEGALEAYGQALEIMKTLGTLDTMGGISLQENIGVIKYTIGEAKEGLTFLEESMRLRESLGLAQSVPACWGLLHLGNAKTKLGDLQGAAEAYEALVNGINARAQVVKGEFGGVDPASLLPPPTDRRSSAAPSAREAHGNHSQLGHNANGDCQDHNCSHSHGHGNGHGHGHSHGGGRVDVSPAQRYGISSFVYRARRPFDSARFQAFVDGLQAKRLSVPLGALHGPPESALSGLMRAKGTCWLTSAPLHEHSWSFAGLTATLKQGNPWWAACSEQHIFLRAAYPGMQGIYDQVRAEAWDQEGGCGDRRQELVFIGGPGMVEEVLRAEIDDCLLTEAEMEVFTEANHDAVAPFELSIGGVSMRMG
mmetsp:Transcript_88748/g.284983  ORF Transcript_88748/g.284983 Transcript_88748/m.284983 type:complete len:464 (+) Transcript_88748:162-1553(+)